MRISEWWPRLASETREWLIANNGDAIPADVLRRINTAGGEVTSDASSIGRGDSDGFYLSDDVTDWIEAVANGETPD